MAGRGLGALARSPKTEHHAGHERRWVPMVPELRRILEEAFAVAPEGHERIVTIRAGGFQNRSMVAYVKRAGVTPWPRLWQTLRSSCEKQWAMCFPQFAVSKWIGHSIMVSGKHYANDVPNELFAKAATMATKAAQNQAQNTAELTEMEDPRKQKSPEFPGFSDPFPSVPIGATPVAPCLTTRV